MFEIRRSDERGAFDHGWLDTRHTFSFADYHDPRFMGFRALRVINEDVVAPGRGFGTHSHRDMEIITYVLSGGLRHDDSMGNGSVIRPGDVQRMSAGTGVRHSEVNASDDEPVHFLQIWILPERRDLTPGYEQKHFDRDDLRGGFRLVASPEGRDGSVTLHQDVRLYSALLDGERAEIELDEGRYAWVQVARGEVELNGERLLQGDGAAMRDERTLKITNAREAEVLLFDLA